ncbi:hypothetical protein RchiOBHm_Chr7g0208381 [Rosa chinensis]|uniref:Uncharacterized protein n=1 Tax=Rosa chinensis TaxID=74649 RepID=A0A2P6P9P8_ROSCH|nr:hypothetical protein RchiOBHm_Chr7g0208381 [Rosa chinensis]
MGVWDHETMCSSPFSQHSFPLCGPLFLSVSFLCSLSLSLSLSLPPLPHAPRVFTLHLSVVFSPSPFIQSFFPTLYSIALFQRHHHYTTALRHPRSTAIFGQPRWHHNHCTTHKERLPDLFPSILIIFFKIWI